MWELNIYIIKNYYMKNIFTFNFLKIIFILFLKQNKNPLTKHTLNVLKITLKKNDKAYFFLDRIRHHLNWLK